MNLHDAAAAIAATLEHYERAARRRDGDGDGFVDPDGPGPLPDKTPAPRKAPRRTKRSRRRAPSDLSDDELLTELETQDWDSDRFRAAIAELGSRHPDLGARAFDLLGERETRERERDQAQAAEAQRLEPTRHIIAGRDDSESAMRHLAREYRNWVAEQMRAAEAHIIGYELNERGKRAGVAPVQVWTSRRDFDRYASRELRDYVEAHPDVWKTFTQWRAQYAPVLQPGRRRSPRRRDPDTPVSVPLPGLTGRPAGRSMRP